jgi:septum formation protein
LNSAPTIILASASPRRQELLRQAGIGFEVQAANIEETRRSDESPAEYVQRVAAGKARHVAGLRAERGLPPQPVLGADTEVVVDDEVLGKPRDRDHAAQLLRRLSGRTHTVLSALCLVLPTSEYRALSESRVRFAALHELEIENYVASGEADDKAGGYAVQGRAAAFIERIEGSYSGIMGLPLFELTQLLKQAGVHRT